MSRNSPNREQKEILALLTAELQEQLDAALDGENGGSSAAERLDQLQADVEKLEHAAQLTGLTGLEGVCAALGQQVAPMAQTSNIGESVQPLLEAWPMYLLDYIGQLESGQPEAESVQALLAFLSDPSWPQPLSTSDHDALYPALCSPDWSLFLEDHSNPLPSQAEASLLDLTPGEDCNPQLFEGLMLELPGQIQRLTDSLDAYTRQNDSDALVQAQRITHTVKGSANVVGITGLANFMHYSEDLLDTLARDYPDGIPGLNDLLMEMADTAAMLMDHLLDGTQPGEPERDTLQRLLDACHGLNEEASQTDIPQAHIDPMPVEEPSAEYETSAETAMRPVPSPGTEPDKPPSTQVRVDEARLQTLLTLAGEASIGNHRLNTQSQTTRQHLQNLGQLQNKLGELIEELGQLIEVRNLFGASNDPDHPDIDPLELNRYNELHSFYHQLQEYAADANGLLQAGRQSLTQLDELSQSQYRNHRSSQEELLSLLSLPFETLDSRLHRCVRQACRLTGKRAQLTVTGGDTRLDRQTLQQLADPLMHLLRNAVDHGIESPETRLQLNKPEEGQIHLHIQPQGQSTQLALTDDGAGLNHQGIADKARELGLEVPESPDTDWLQTMIFTSGFSTRKQVSQTSGRGIGLDAVAEQLRDLHGHIQLDPGHEGGTSWHLTLPNRLVAEHHLLVQLGEQSLALSSRGVQQVLYVEPEHLSNRGERLYYQYGERELLIWHLAQVAPLANVPVADTRQAQALLLVNTGDTNAPVGLLVDRILASREMVVKPLPDYTPELPGVLGATILGDGRVAPVIDTRVLLEHAGKDQGQKIADRHVQTQAAPARPLALIVDDSLSTRRSLSEFVAELGMDVVTARDGFEAIEKLSQRRPSLVLVDMEMPRMNGLEFTAHIKAQEALRDIPVIMITSRNTEKHRQLADAAGVDAYLNKPFSEDELLHSIEGRKH